MLAWLYHRAGTEDQCTLGHSQLSTWLYRELCETKRDTMTVTLVCLLKVREEAGACASGVHVHVAGCNATMLGYTGGE